SSRRKRKNCWLVSGRSPARCRSEMNSARCVTSPPALLFVCYQRGGLDHHGFTRHVAHAAGIAGLDLADFRDHVHTGNDLAEHGVTPAVLARVVEEVVALGV